MKKKGPPNFDQLLFAVVYPAAYLELKKHSHNGSQYPARLSPAEIINDVTFLNLKKLKKQTVIPRDSKDFEALKCAMELAQRKKFTKIIAIWADGSAGFVNYSNPDSRHPQPLHIDVMQGYFEAYCRPTRFPKHYQSALANRR